MAKVVALVSGGIDSAAAISLALEQGMDVVAVHFRTSEADKRAEEKTFKLVKHIEKRFGKKIPLFVVPFQGVLEEIVKKCERKLACVLCKRMMQRVASRIALKEEASALLMGDSLGQVASQTLANLEAEHSAAEFTVIRPLLGMDKLEIEKIARNFGTLEISNMPSACCAVPKKPATSAKRAFVEAEEAKISVENLAESCFSKALKKA